MARALAVKLDADFAPTVDVVPGDRPTAPVQVESARSLQQRLSEAYAAPAELSRGRELSAFARLTIIVGASSLLWSGIAAAAAALI